jgi:hypothetical protein
VTPLEALTLLAQLSHEAKRDAHPDAHPEAHRDVAG